MPIIVDAGIGRPSQACEAMEMGAAAVMANTAIATAGDVPKMAQAFKKAIEAGRESYLAGFGDVVEKGAPVLVVEHPVEAPENVTVIQVENGRNALSLLSAARFDYPARKMTAIGVTGTKGKTTTTYMIKAILEAAGQKTGLIGTNGAVIGENHYPTKNTTPESYILQEYFAKLVEAGCRYIVMEVSSQSYLMHRVDGLFL